MAKEFVCKDIGMNCGFKASAKTEEELMPKIAQHAKEAHQLDPVPAETLQKIKAAIKEKKGWF
jgi:predicted small metal-binding protein